MTSPIEEELTPDLDGVQDNGALEDDEELE